MRHVLLKMLGATLFTIFVPAILYFQLWLSLAQVFLFFWLHSFLSLFFQRFVSARLLARVGAKWSMMIGIFGFIGYMIILMLANTYPHIVFVWPLFSSVHTAFFRLAFHYNMSLRRRKEHTLGQKFALIEIIRTLAAASGPLIWGWIADSMWISMMFGVALSFVVLSLIPFFHTYKKHKIQKFSWVRERKLILKNKSLVKQVMTTFASVAYIQFVWAVLRSIALFAFFQSFTKMWIVTTITTILVVILLYFIGKLSDYDDEKAKKLVRRSTWFQWGNWLSASIMIFIGSFTQIGYMFIDTIQKLTYRINNTYLTKIFYDHAGIDFEKNPVYLVILRESSVHLAKLFFSLFFAGLFALIGNEVSYLALPFIVVVWAVPLQLMLIKRYRNISEKE